MGSSTLIAQMEEFQTDWKSEAAGQARSEWFGDLELCVMSDCLLSCEDIAVLTKMSSWRRNYNVKLHIVCFPDCKVFAFWLFKDS